jgi:hypothetical protein
MFVNSFLAVDQFKSSLPRRVKTALMTVNAKAGGFEKAFNSAI